MELIVIIVDIPGPAARATQRRRHEAADGTGAAAR
jgi:hypothetical protein